MAQTVATPKSGSIDKRKGSLRPHSTARVTYSPRSIFKFDTLGECHSLDSPIFVNNSCTQGDQRNTLPHLSIQELLNAEMYWLVLSQVEQFGEEIEALRRNQILSNQVRYSLFVQSWVLVVSCFLVAGYETLNFATLFGTQLSSTESTKSRN